MKTKTNIFFTTIVMAGLMIAACEGPEGPTGPQGSQGDQGAVGPAGVQGEPGNANVTLYTFPGHDFGEDSQWLYCFQSLNKEEWEFSQWSVFFILEQQLQGGGSQMAKFSIDNFSDLSFITAWNIDTPEIMCADKALVAITDLGNVPDSEVDGFHIIRIESESIEDCGEGNCKRSAEPAIPAGLDMTDYDAIIEYFGLTEDDIVRM